MIKQWNASFLLLVSFIIGTTLFLLINTVSSHFSIRSDFTQSKQYQLPESAVTALSQLKEPVTLTLFYHPTHPYYKKIRDLLKEIDLLKNENLKIHLIDPDRDRAKTELFEKKHQLAARNKLIIQSGPCLQQLSDSDFVEEKEKATFFKASSSILNAILSVTQLEGRKVYFVTGHGEKEIDDISERGIAALKIYFKKNNLMSEKWLLPSKKELPNDATLLAIVGPTKKFEEDEILLLKEYVASGGELFLFLDPLVNTGLESLLSEWDVYAANQVVVDPSTGSPQISAANLFVSNYTEHPAIQQMKGVVTLFVVARPFFDKEESDVWTVSPLAITTPNGWGEASVTSQVYQFDRGQDTKGPVVVAVAVESQDPVKGHVVIVGDSEFVTNSQLGNVGNQDFLTSNLRWLLAQQNWITLPPKRIQEVQLHLNKKEMTQIFWSSVVFLPFMSLCLGTFVWSRRRV